jgi:hypothetical protein
MALPSFIRPPEIEPRHPLTALTFVVVDTQLSDDESDPFSSTPTEAVMKRSERNDPIESLVHTPAEPADVGQLPHPPDEDSQHEPFDDARSEFSFFAPTLGLEPRPAWLNAPVQPRPVPAEEARRLSNRSTFPIRPLHKQPFYRRIFFYLRGWLTRTFRKSP